MLTRSPGTPIVHCLPTPGRPPSRGTKDEFPPTGLDTPVPRSVEGVLDFGCLGLRTQAMLLRRLCPRLTPQATMKLSSGHCAKEFKTLITYILSLGVKAYTRE